MSEATTEKPSEIIFKDDLQRVQHEQFTKFIADKNDKVGRLNAAQGDRQSLTEQIRENSTDEDIVHAREQMSQWSERLNELVKPIVDKTIEDSAGSQTKLENSIVELDKILKPGLKYYKTVYGEDAYNALPDQVRIKGTQVRGAGGRRLRGWNVIVTVDGETEEFENFSSAAKFIGCDTADLQNALFEKAGTDAADKLPQEVNFTVSFVEVDKDNNETEKSAFVKAYQQEKAKSNDAAAVADEPEGHGDSDDNGFPDDGAANTDDDVDPSEVL